MLDILHLVKEYERLFPGMFIVHFENGVQVLGSQFGEAFILKVEVQNLVPSMACRQNLPDSLIHQV